MFRVLEIVFQPNYVGLQKCIAKRPKVTSLPKPYSLFDKHTLVSLNVLNVLSTLIESTKALTTPNNNLLSGWNLYLKSQRSSSTVEHMFSHYF